MEQAKIDPAIANDVLHNPDHSKLTQEEIAKALAHHNKRHRDESQQSANPKGQPGLKQSR